jgi:hypothetical protein
MAQGKGSLSPLATYFKASAIHHNPVVSKKPLHNQRWFT